MKFEIQEIAKEKKNFVFIGGAGSGKSEISVNFAMKLFEVTGEYVHFFDLDMTKPLFRTRDLEEATKKAGLKMHYQVQFMDAPTLVGGVRSMMKDKDIYTVLDIGGDYIGSRTIGGYASLLNEEDTAVFYVLNPYRPWTDNLEHIDGTLSKILETSHINFEKIQFISNPNYGVGTTASEAIDGNENLCKMLGSKFEPIMLCVMDSIAEETEKRTDIPILPLNIFLTAQWIERKEC